MNVSNVFDRDGKLKNWKTISQEFMSNPIHFFKWYGVVTRQNFLQTAFSFNFWEVFPAKEF